MILLLESKRDDLLLPYFELVKDKIPGLTLGKFKGLMLDKLGAQGGMHNLSKSSNFYLAGATRYYFNGDLTVGTPALLSDNPDGHDEWNAEVCKRLDALIDILRTAYIDSVGEAFEQPEDFGNLPIAKLLKKYSKKINAYLGIDDGTSNGKKEAGNEVIDTRVGNGYSFHILYSYPEGTKYERFTAPGAWCITYGKNHYDGYIRRLNIHYVIFLKDGYENVKRQTGPGFTKLKPHDEYGNSMIALLQSNVDGKPVYITSRWNHGYGETSGTEADHAYTPEEFYNITGVTPEDLQRIFQIWKKEAPNHREHKGKTIDPVEKARKLEGLRALKYIQMRINGGEDPNALLKPYQMLYGKMPERDEDGVVRKKVNFRNCVMICSKMPEGEERVNEYFLVDKGKIIFETISEGRPNWDFTMSTAELYFKDESEDGAGKPHNLIIFKGNGGGYGLYDTRRHDFVSIGGTKRFRSIPERWSSCGSRYLPQFMQIKMSTNDIALLSLSNNMPLKLPNGEFWFNDMRSNATKSNSESYGRSIRADFAGTNDDGLIEIDYDISSGEKYFYSTEQRKFVDLSYILQYIGDENHTSLFLNTRSRRKILGEYDRIDARTPGDIWRSAPSVLVGKNGNIAKIGPFDKFGDLDDENSCILCFVPVKKNEEGKWVGLNGGSGPNKRLVFNKKTGSILKLNGKYLFVQGTSSSYTDSKYVVLSQYHTAVSRGWEDYRMVYDMEENAILKNPFGYPGTYLFDPAGLQGRELMRIYKEPHRSFSWQERDEHNPEFNNCTEIIHFNNLEKIPLDNDSYSVEYQQSPALSLAERITINDIKSIVKETLNRIQHGK